MKIKKLKVFGVALSGILTMTSLSGCGNSSMYQEEKGVKFTRKFAVGEHIISVPLEDDISEKTMQIESHPGYDIKGISIAAWGEFFPSYAGGVIVYSNSEEVECKSNMYDDNGNYVYLDFGTPLDYEEDKNVDNDGIKEFDVGEHIISIPLEDDISEGNTQYEYHEGYEVVGITISAYGRFAPSYAGGAILYKNVVPIRAKIHEDGYTTFGEPIEKEQAKTLK